MFKILDKKCNIPEYIGQYSKSEIEAFQARFNLMFFDQCTARLEWKNNSKEIFYPDYCWYMIFLIQMIDCFHSFFCSNKIENNFIYKFSIDYVSSLNCLNNFDIDGKLYFWLDGFALPDYLLEEKACSSIEIVNERNHQFITDFLRMQDELLKKKQLETNGRILRTYFISEKPTPLFNDFSKLYSKNIVDLHPKSIYWEMKEMLEHKRKLEEVEKFMEKLA
jgi:hypothetical protein